MATFDPSKAPSGDFEALPAGRYVIAMVDYERKTSSKQTEYLRCKFKVVHGNGKTRGRTFYSSVALDVSNPSIAARLGLYCKAVGVTKAFDLDSDAALDRAFLGKPFCAQVSQEQSGRYTNNDVKRYVLELTADEQAAAEAFWDDWQAKQREQQDDGFDSDAEWNPDEMGGGDFGGGDPDIPF